ncbi:MAG: aminopeptidase [Longimicrobiales bacterium]
MRAIIRATFVVVVAGALGACSPLYVLRAGIEEARILSRRQPISELVAAPATPPEVRRKLALVLDARTFADEGLGLDVGDSYTTFSRIDRDTLALVLSAARQDRFEQVTWWFPIVGRIPYKGFFSSASAQRAARGLEAKGYDTYIRPTAAFSTLGWFSDPLLSTLLDYDDVTLVATVIHELTHNSLYLPSQAAFNESFASFVGDRGAAEFFCRLEGDDAPRCRRALAFWRDNLRFGGFLESLIRELETLYGRTDLSLEQTLRLREVVFADARQRFAAELQPTLEVTTFEAFARAPLNNATLIARRLYFDRLHRFEAAYEALGRDLAAATAAIMQAAEAAEGDPYGALERIIAAAAGVVPTPAPAPAPAPAPRL